MSLASGISRCSIVMPATLLSDMPADENAKRGPAATGTIVVAATGRPVAMSPDRNGPDNRRRPVTTTATEAPTIEPMPIETFIKPTPDSPVPSTSNANTMISTSITPKTNVHMPSRPTSKRARGSCHAVRIPSESSRRSAGGADGSRTAAGEGGMLATSTVPTTSNRASAASTDPGPDREPLMAKAIVASKGPRNEQALSIMPVAAYAAVRSLGVGASPGSTALCVGLTRVSSAAEIVAAAYTTTGDSPVSIAIAVAPVPSARPA